MLLGILPEVHCGPLLRAVARPQAKRVYLQVAAAARRVSKSGEIEARKPLFQRFADEGSLDSLDLAISDWDEGLDEEFGAKVREIASQGFNLQKFVPSGPDGPDAQVESSRDASQAAQTQRKFPRESPGWYVMPGLSVQDLYLGILQHCEQGQVDVAPLYAVLRAARTEADAGLCLSALSVYRIARLRRNILQPFHPRLAAAFIWMCVQCDAGDVLVEAMERAPELGLRLSGRRVHLAMKLWGESGRLDLLERIYRAMPAAGVAVSGRTTYTLMRSAMNLGRYEWVLECMRELREQQVPIQAALESLAKVAQERLASGEGVDGSKHPQLLEKHTSKHPTSAAF